MLAQVTDPTNIASWGRKLSGPDWWILVCYFLLMLGIGLYFYRYMRGMKDYFRGGSTIPWWLSGISYWMTSFSAFAFIYYSSLSYKYGLFGVAVYWVTVPATLVSLLFFASPWRRARIDSPVEFVETRYGAFLRQLFAWQGIPVKIIDDGLKIVAIGKFISVGLHLDMTQAMVWSSLIMLAYTFMGGLWAATITDFVQFVVMMAAVLILFPLVFQQAGGFFEFFRTVPPERMRITNENFEWYYIVGLIVMYCLSFSVNWSLINRFYCVPTEKDAKKVGWLVVILNIVGPPLMFMPAMAARSFLGDLPDNATDQVYPLMCARLLPAGMFGLIIVAMFSATMSTLSGDANVVASVLTNDIYRRLFRPKASNRELVAVGRIMTLLAGLGALGIAFLVVGFTGEDQFKNMVTLFSVVVAPVAVPMLLGLVSRRVTNSSAVASFLAGLTVGLALFILLPRQFTMYGHLVQRETIIVFATLVATVGNLLLDLWQHRMSAEERARIEPFHVRLETPIGQLEEDLPPAPGEAGSVPSPFRLVGFTLVTTAIMILAVLPWVRPQPGMLLKSNAMVLGLNLIICIGLGGLGVLMIRLTRRPAPATAEPLADVVPES